MTPVSPGGHCAVDTGAVVAAAERGTARVAAAMTAATA